MSKQFIHPITPLYYRLKAVESTLQELPEKEANNYKLQIITSHLNSLNPELNEGFSYYTPLDGETSKNMILEEAMNRRYSLETHGLGISLIQRYSAVKRDFWSLESNIKKLEESPRIFRAVEELRDIIGFDLNTRGTIAKFFGKSICGIADAGTSSVNYFALFNEASRKRAEYVNRELIYLF